MILDMTGKTIERPEPWDFADLTTTSGAVYQGGARWVPDQPNMLELPFTPEAAESERWPITRRIITKDASEETLYRQAEDSRTANIAWRSNTSPQITTGAQAIENDASITSTEVPVYLRQLASGVRTLNTQLVALSNQNNNIIKMLLKLLNSD